MSRLDLVTGYNSLVSDDSPLTRLLEKHREPKGREMGENSCVASLEDESKLRQNLMRQVFLAKDLRNFWRRTQAMESRGNLEGRNPGQKSEEIKETLRGLSENIQASLNELNAVETSLNFVRQFLK